MVEVNPFSAINQVSQASTDAASLGGSLDSFLQLLITQLQNQDPLDPVDTNQFTQQLVQFTEVEQTVKMNDHLETLINLSAASTITNVVGYIGKEITGSGSVSDLQNGVASWQYSVPASSDDALFTVADADGNIVFSQSQSIPAGPGSFVWNGQTTGGGTAPAGAYQLSIRATDASGNLLDASTSFTGIVDGVDMSSSEVLLTSGTRTIKLDEVISINSPSIP